MLDLDQIYRQVEEKLTHERFIHSQGVAKTAANLALAYGEDPLMAEIAGISHDCAKEIPKERMKELLCSFGYQSDNNNPFVLEQPNLMHSMLGFFIAKNEFGIENINVLNAIRYHTTGKENMTLLEKIVYVADYIEPGRIFGVNDWVRGLAFKNIDKVVMLRLNFTIRKTLDKGVCIHHDTISARNYLIKAGELYRDE